ncbi:1-phosphatidylinositol-3-phosphate 5-kinase FAB1B-like protein [Tanacetum coccineum]
MDASENTSLPNLVVGALKSWGVPRRPDPVNVSRDFWMPDRCRVCYDCDSQFTLFNRRHHCRFCGRVFCVVCNYCFKQWQQQQQGGLADHDDFISTTSLSPSAASFISTKSSDNTSCVTFTSAPSCSDFGSSVMESNLDNNEFAYLRRHSRDDNAFYDALQMEDVGSDYGSRKVHPDGEPVSSSSLQNSFEKKEDENDVSDEGEASSSMYAPQQMIEAEPLDFENNAQLWLPPEPEDEEDEREGLIYYDDEDEDDGNGDGVGEWGYTRNASNLGSGEFRNRERSNEEHKKAMKTVVDGHFRALVSQLLQVENLDDTDNWLEIITLLSWEAASLLKPDTSKGGGMDPGGYVKKSNALASGPMVVKGVVCKKNVAHRRMTSRIEKPRILILGGARRVSRSEMDHLKMAVAKIDAHQPDVLLVEKSVSRYAQEYLLAKDISLVLNIKRPLLERIARCTGAQIAPSVDHLSSQTLGYCDTFHVEKFLEEHGTAGQGGKKLVKTLMYFEGCPKPLGCTILLRGASLPDLPLNSPLTVALPDKASIIDRSISTIPGFTLPLNQNAPEQPPPMSDTTGGGSPIDAPTETKVSSEPVTSADVTANNGFEHPQALGDLVRSPEIGDEMQNVDQDGLDGNNAKDEYGSLKDEFPPTPSDNQSILVTLSSRCVAKGTVCERSHLFRIKYYGNFDKPLGRFLRDNLFDQNYRCPSCEMPSEAHVQCYTHREGTLTISVKKLADALPGENDGKIWMWHRCLKCPRVDGSPPAIRRIVMSDAAWGLSFGKFLELSFSNHAAASRVANCGHTLHRDCLRFYGFGKMVACFRYASINVHSVYLPPSKLVFNYENQEWIQNEVNEVVGRAELLFSKILNALTQMAEKKFGKTSGNSSANMPPSRRQLADLEEMLQKEKAEFEESLQKVLNQEGKKDQPMIDILEINRLRRQLLFQSYVWDHRLVHAASVHINSPRDDINDLILENMVRPNETPVDSDASENVDMKQFEPQVTDKESEVVVDSSPKEENEIHVSDPLRGNVGGGVHRAFSEGQISSMASLSDTLDAAWTGNQMDTPSVMSDSDKGHHGEDQLLTASSLPSPTSSLPSENISEDSTSWFSMPFLNFYRALNKNFIATSQNLDTLKNYKPVYISTYRESELEGGARLLLAVGVNDTVIPVYDDEPTSIISYALLTPDYMSQMSGDSERLKDGGESIFSSQSADSAMFQSLSNFDEAHGSMMDRLVTKTELESFIKFAPAYFKYLSESIGTGSPTCLAKILGIYQVTRQMKGGKETKMDVLVMENLLFGRNLTRLYDLKGSARSRYNADVNGSNKVLLDQNLIEAMPTSPIFVGNKAKRLLERAVWNDTAFLATIDVMDYSLLVGVDEEKHELVLGIIDFMRQYTWDKHLETWVKASGILGGPKNAPPTVISPKQYKKRFRKAMTTYFLMVPDQWSPPAVMPSKSQADLTEEDNKSHDADQ